jgi:simple sugar transport system ATP-binding protein
MQAPVLEGSELVVDSASAGSLAGVSIKLLPGKVTCVLGDAGAGGRGLVEALGGLAPLASGGLVVRGREHAGWSPGAAARAGIGVALGAEGLLPGVPVWRSYVLGREPCLGVFPLRLLRRRKARATVVEAMRRLGVTNLDPDLAPERLPEEIRRLLLVARAFERGERAVLLYEPTQRLPVEAAARVLDRVLAARERGAAVLLATGNVQHAWAVGDRFQLLYVGRALGTFDKQATSREELYRIMLGNQDLEELTTELAALGWERADAPPAAPALGAEAPAEAGPAAEPPPPVAHGAGAPAASPPPVAGKTEVSA